MNAPQYIPSFYFYKFAEGISAPYTSFAAYRAGAIDERGNIVKPESSIDPLEYLIIKLKKIFEEIPQGMTRAKLGNYMSTMQLFGEEVQKIGITESEYQGLVEGYLALYVNPELSYIELCEDMSAQGMGTPGSSPDYNTGKVSGYDPVIGLTKRTEPVLKGLDTCEMFDVCPEEMSGFKGAKAWKHVPDSETKRYLQRYQRRNPKGHMAIRSVDPDTGKSEIHWIKLKPISFMEEFGLMDLDILNEEDQSIVAQYNDADDKPGEPSVAVLTDTEEAKKAKAKAQKKGYVRPPVSPGTTHEQRFRENMAELVRMHGEAIGGGRHGHAAEYEAKMMFHARAYHELKDTPHIHGYMDTVHQGIISPVSATDRSGKGGDVHVTSVADDKLKIEPVEVKTRGASSKRVMPVSLMQHLLDTVPDAMSAWAKAIPGRQRFLFSKGDPEGAEERFKQAKAAIEQSEDPVIVKGREESAAKLRQRTSGRTLIKNSNTGRFHFVNPQAQAPEVTMGQQWGQGPKTMGKEIGRHQVGYRTNYNRPPEDSEVFSISKDVQDTMLAHVDPEHHELLKKLSGVHIG
jgi:hypothetical protein